MSMTPVEEFHEQKVYTYEQGTSNPTEHTLPDYASNIFAQIETPEDVCQHVSELMEILIHAHAALRKVLPTRRSKEP